MGHPTWFHPSAITKVYFSEPRDPDVINVVSKRSGGDSLSVQNVAFSKGQAVGKAFVLSTWNRFLKSSMF